MPLTSILKTTGNNKLSPQATRNEVNHDISHAGDSDHGVNVGGAVGENVENMSTGKLSKAKKPNLAKSKKSKLVEGKKLDLQ